MSMSLTEGSSKPRATGSLPSADRPTLANLGCGSRFHADWLNFDLHPVSPAVRRADFIKRVPLSDASADCVYHSHVLEHLSRDDGRKFLVECRRALKPGGVLRVVVPDLEASARDYVAVVDRRRGGDAVTAQHEWMVVEMLDQMVRETRGGRMGEMMHRAAYDPALRAFIVPRLGESGRAIPSREGVAPPSSHGRYERVMRFFARFGSVGRAIAHWMIVRQGVQHRWMYDEFSLGDLLRSVGFTHVVRQSYNTSLVPNWETYLLDADADGQQYKGVSLYMEAVR